MAAVNKRLVLVVPTFPKLSETFIVSKFIGLLESDWDVHILCSRRDKQAWCSFPVLENNTGLTNRVHTAWPTRSRFLAMLLLPILLVRSLLLAPKTTWRYLAKGYQRFGWDVFHRFYLDAELIRLKPSLLHFEFGALAVGRTYLREVLGIKLSASFRGYDLNFVGLDQPDYYAEVWNNADACHFLGEDLWRRAQRRACPPDMPHMLISPAVDLSILSSFMMRRSGVLGTIEEPLRILSIGRLAWKKGYEYTLHAIKLLIDQGINCTYHIIGSGPYEPAVYFARHQFRLENVVSFVGALAHSEVIDWLKWSDIFLHGAVSEGFCNAVLEAQAVGLPVVCTDADGLPENVLDGVTGYVVPRRDPAAMAEKVILLAGNGELRQRMGTAGRERVKMYFSYQNQTQDFDVFYQQMLL